MVRLFEARSEVQAQVVISFLDGHGMSAHAEGGILSALAGATSALGVVHTVVDESVADDARKFIAQMRLG